MDESHKQELLRKLRDRLDFQRLRAAGTQVVRDEVLVLIRGILNNEPVPLAFSEREKVVSEILEAIFREIESGVAVGLLAQNQERLEALQKRLEGANVARLILSHVGFPGSTNEPVVGQIQKLRPDVVIVDVDSKNPRAAIHAISLVRETARDTTIFAIGEMHNPKTIVAAMRAGAANFIDDTEGVDGVREALASHAAAGGRSRRTGRARIITIINAKGGAGATTVAVNTAIALQQNHGPTVLVDFAQIGHAGLHLNVRSTYATYDVLDVLKNPHWMDESLLKGFMTSTDQGISLLAGVQQPYTETPPVETLTRLFEMLRHEYQYVVVDCSSRLDETARLISSLSDSVLLVAHADVVSLWSVGRICTFLEKGTRLARPRLVMNRYKRVPAFDEGNIKEITNCEVLGKVPESPMIGVSIDRGVPIIIQDAHGVGQAFTSLAQNLATEDDAGEDGWSSPRGDLGPSGGSTPPTVPIGVPRSGGPRTLPPRKMPRGA